jgi:hypothetical protein
VAALSSAPLYPGGGAVYRPVPVRPGGAGTSGTSEKGRLCLLRSNETFEIVLFNTYLERFQREMFERDMPLCLVDEGGSIWLRRVR